MSDYVTIEEADEYVSTHFVSTDTKRASWEILQDSDKQVLLNQSLDAINSLMYAGRKTNMESENAFPRYPHSEVPKAIKAAQVENAVVLGDAESMEDAATYQRMWTYGITSYSIGSLSESMGAASVGSSAISQQGIVATKAQALLRPYLGGGYCIE